MSSQTNARFNFITIANDLDPSTSREIIDDYTAVLKNYGGEEIKTYSETAGLPTFIFIANGGTEKKVLDLCNSTLQQQGMVPFYFISHPGNNSLPASLEILARLKNEGAKGKIIFLGDNTGKDNLPDLEEAIKQLAVFHRLKKIRIGLYGKPSDWLVASMPELSLVKRVWGPEILEISMDELESSIEEVKDDEIEEEYFSFTSRSGEIKEPTKKEIKHAVKVYTAIKKLAVHYNLNALTVRCFDLVRDLKTSGCFALSKLNDDGIISACEGDLVSLVGMIWANLMTDQSIWMANPARISEQNNSILLAHCTAPMNMLQSYKIRSHFESGLGVGIQGELSKGKVTLFRLGGRNLESIWISNGEILESGDEDNLCRTQVNIKLHGAAKPEDLLTKPLGNHLLMMRGSYAKELHNWWDTFIS